MKRWILEGKGSILPAYSAIFWSLFSLYVTHEFFTRALEGNEKCYLIRQLEILITVVEVVLHVISKCSPMLHSFQGALPHLPLPSLDDTVRKVLSLYLSLSKCLSLSLCVSRTFYLSLSFLHLSLWIRKTGLKYDREKKKFLCKTLLEPVSKKFRKRKMEERKLTNYASQVCIFTVLVHVIIMKSCFSSVQAEAQ